MERRVAVPTALLLGALSFTPDAALAQADAAAPKPAETAIPPAPKDAEELACRPDCRAAYVCVDGQCVSACNPPCEAGTRCTAEATCEAMPVTSPAPASSAIPASAIATPAPTTASEPDADAQLNAELRARKLEARAKRERWLQAHRYDQHLTLGVAGRTGILELRGDEGRADAVIDGYGILTVGYMHNFAEYFGLLVRLNLGFGGVGLTSYREVSGGADYTDGDATFASLVELEVTPYAGNFGPFYVGPMAFVGYRGYADHRLETERLGTTLRSVARRNRAVAGAGLHMGVLLGRRRDLQLSWSFRSSFNETLPFEGQVGFGYRFGHRWSTAEP